MVIVIDGYNLIKQVLGTKRVSDHERHQFEAKIEHYLRCKRHQGIIVFDGGADRFISRTKKGPLTIVFAGYKRTADDVIMHYLYENREEELLLVSSDRELRDYAHTLSKESMGANEFFYGYVSKPVESKKIGTDDRLFKVNEDAPIELDDLMLQMTETLEIKSDDQDVLEVPRHKSAQKSPKKVRKRNKILDKL